MAKLSDHSLQDPQASTPSPKEYSLQELGGPFAKGFDRLDTQKDNRLAAAFRDAQRKIQPRMMPIAAGKMARGK